MFKRQIKKSIWGETLPPLSEEEMTKAEEEKMQRDNELIEVKEQLRKNIDSLIESLDQMPYMDFTLAHLKEPKLIAQHLNDKLKIYSFTWAALITLSNTLRKRADMVDDKNQYLKKPLQSDINKPTWMEAIKILPPNQPTTNQSSKNPHSVEGNELRILAENLDSEAEYYFNNRKELKDGDPNATPLTLFAVARLSRFLPTLPDDKARYTYLSKLKLAFLHKNSMGDVYFNGEKRFHADEDFQLHLENELGVYEKIVVGMNQKYSADAPTVNKKEKRMEGGSYHQNLLAIHYLFKHLGVENKSAISRFASFLTGFSQHSFRNDSSNIFSKQEANGVQWDADMQKVQKYFKELGLTKIVENINDDLKDFDS